MHLRPYHVLLRGCSLIFFAAVALFTLPVCAVHADPQAAHRSAAITIGGVPVPFLVSPFVDSDGTVLAPVDIVRRMGGDYEPIAGGATVAITTASGNRFEVACKTLQDRYFVSISQIATLYGASMSYDDRTATVALRARLEMVRQDSQTLSIYTSYPVSYAVNRLLSPNRVYVDLLGVDLSASPASVPALNSYITQIRSGQINSNTVRIVIDLRQDAQFSIVSPQQTAQVKVALSGPSEPDAPAIPVLPVSPPVAINVHPLSPPMPSPVHPSDPSVAMASPDTTSSEPPPLRVPGQPVHLAAAPRQPAPTVRVTGISWDVAGGNVEVRIRTTGTAKYRTEALDAPNRLAFDLADATIDPSVASSINIGDPVVKSLRAGILSAGQTRFGRIVVDLARLVSYNISSTSDAGGSTYLLTLVRPAFTAPTPTPPSIVLPAPTGDLRGKIVCVDPGHGADDSGSLGINGEYEKTYTLQIGEKLRDALQAAGAIVRMTRDTDVLPTVDERPRMAIAWGADYFISIHCDSAGQVNQFSGTTVYYHAQNTICMQMASDISTRIGAVSGIPRLGTKSDTIRFQTGFGVLRGSPMPAVLIECGYMNNERDLQKLKDQATQQRIADAITAGLRDFISDRAAGRE